MKKDLDQPENNDFLSDFQLDRYSRQLILPEISEKGQKKLLSSKIAIIGCGGLGCPVALYLSAAGIGSITLVDDEKIELSNLNRQIAFKQSDVNNSKSETLQSVIKKINPEININFLNQKLNEKNADKIFLGKNLIIDCTDNYETRYLIAKNCYKLGIPMSFGAAVRQEGQTAFFKAGYKNVNKKKISLEHPCYACIFPKKPNTKVIPRCSEVGILGSITGIISSIQSLNVLRFITNQTVSNDLILWDGISFYEIKIQKNKSCKICGTL